MPTKVKGTTGVDKIEAGAVITNPSFSGNATVTGTLTVDSTASINGSNLPQQFNFRNLIINGDMRIAQRGTSFTNISQGSNEGYTLDRWRFQIFGTSAHGTYTVSQDTDVPNGQGFASSVKVSCTTADTSLAADTSVIIDTRLEGQNLQHLKKGTSAAEKLTVSFWVKSNLTGNAVLYLYDHNNSREIASLVNISTANTWEKKTITFDGDTIGAFNNNNGLSLTVRLYMAAGSDQTSGTLPTSWQNYNAGDTAAGISIDIGSSTSNYINITGVQLEVGEGASDFEFLPYDVQLPRCQRYFYKGFVACVASGSNATIPNRPYPVFLRTAGSFSISYGGVANRVYRTVDAGLRDLVSPVMNGDVASFNTLYAFTPTNWALSAGGINFNLEVNAEL